MGDGRFSSGNLGAYGGLEDAGLGLGCRLRSVYARTQRVDVGNRREVIQPDGPAFLIHLVNQLAEGVEANRRLVLVPEFQGHRDWIWLRRLRLSW